MSIKKIITYLLIIGLVAFEGYLVFNLVSGNISNQKETTQYCSAKCDYSQDSSLYEFSGESATKGFTTEDECLRYCSQVKNGFAYYLSEYSAAFLGFFHINFNR